VNPFCRILFPALFAGIAAVIFLHVRPFSPLEPFWLEVKMNADQAGRARVYYDRGNGFVPYDMLGAEVKQGAQTVRFPLPDGSLKALRFWPLDRVGRVNIESMEVKGPEGNARWSLAVDRLGELETKPGQGRDFSLEPAVELQRTLEVRTTRMLIDFAIAAAAMALLVAAGGSLPAGFRERMGEGLAATRRGLERVPHFVLLVAAVTATALSCWPVIFEGRSFVSPGNGTMLLFDDAPTIEGAPLPPVEDARGADMGALMWAHVPYAAIEHRAIFNDGEWPLWNRYNYCGVPLLGQGMAMLGDPLHWLPIATVSAAWAWDVKFLLAKTIFALGIGLCVRAATGRLWLAALLALSSSFLGFFSYRFAHPAFFAMCYAPWILHAWLRVASTRGRVWPWALAVALASFWQLNTGVMKESAMLVVGLNFTGLLLVLCAEQADRVRRVGAMLWGGGLFVLISAPCWLIFLDALGNSWTPYDEPRAYQIPPAMALGLFDDLFYRQFTEWEKHYNPSANFLILLGCMWALANLRTLLADRTFVALAIGALPSAALAFGVVPAEIIKRVPFLANVEHVDNTFSVVLIVHLIVLSAFGLRALWESTRTPALRKDWALALVVLGALLAMYLGTAHAIPRGVPGPKEATQPGMFFIGYGTLLLAAVLALPWVVRSLRASPSFAALLAGAVILFAIHFRHGMWMETAFDYYVMTPKARADLAAASPSLDMVKEKIAESGEPARVAGFRLALVPGYQALLGFEHFAGADALVSRHQRELCALIGSEPMWGWRWQVGAPEDRTWRLTQKLCDLWNVRWIVAVPADVPVGKAHGDLTTNESPFAWPRAFFTEQLLECTPQATFAELLDESQRPFAALTPTGTLKPDKPPQGDDRLREIRKMLDQASHYPAKNYRLTSNTTAFDIEALAPGVVVLGETYEPHNWRVTVNGRRVDYFRVNHAFLGVKIDRPGKHHLHFEYWPRRMNLALWLGGTGVFLVLLTPLLARLCFGAPPIR
jgi:hypothetical protein